VSRAITFAVKGVLVGVLAVAVVGCASNKLKKENEGYKTQILQLQSDLDNANAEAKRLADENAQLKAQPAAPTAAPAAETSGVAARVAELRAQGLDASERNGMVVITMEQKVLYNSGSATVSKGGRAKLMIVAHALSSGEFARFAVEIEGHTDSDPIRRTKDKYKSNWELSYARAQNVADYLIKSGKISPSRIHVSAYGQYDSVASNKTKSGKAQNRRVEITLMEPAGRAAMESTSEVPGKRGTKSAK